MTTQEPKVQFNFGENWEAFSNSSLSHEALVQSRTSFIKLLGTDNLKGKTLVDIGFGQGLGVLNAASLGANVVGCDINPLCGQVLEGNKKLYPHLAETNIPVVIGSILDSAVVEELDKSSPDGEGKKYDIVHSWGVLHHTGSMWQAIQNSMSLVKDNGTFVIAIYNRHWSSYGWTLVKRLYNFLPKWGKWLMAQTFYLIIFVAKFLVTFKNPLKKDRGMNFYYDVIDWLGGYPYEYASKEEIENYFKEHGFKLNNYFEAEVPTGCNQFVFEKMK
jgi:2-polyprenyl-6-hydroxyphenyl methylase/3-demethylubiquinone-9 3-methyltransferase